MHSNDKLIGLVWDLNPGPLAPKARIIPLDQRASSTNSDYKHLKLSYSVSARDSPFIIPTVQQIFMKGIKPQFVNQLNPLDCNIGLFHELHIAL